MISRTCRVGVPRSVEGRSSKLVKVAGSQMRRGGAGRGRHHSTGFDHVAAAVHRGFAIEGDPGDLVERVESNSTITSSRRDDASPCGLTT
ncbi:hypothetical protein DBV15_09647 [Temnothorax longispinosus]|uniref:Uncharacterized protein n=1 Tax=Temnothorax longispinosus TaxID=300112 RepID=A0A4S2KEM4_9HYME|nr:hypothetical protein DBV15_09647 [Temnothorax longispinosus]